MDKHPLSTLKKIYKGKQLFDKIFRKINYLNRHDPASIFADHDKLSQIDQLIGKGWDVNAEGKRVFDETLEPHSYRVTK